VKEYMAMLNYFDKKDHRASSIRKSLVDFTKEIPDTYSSMVMHNNSPHKPTDFNCTIEKQLL